MASTGKNYKIEVGLYADTKKSQTNIQNALKVIQSKISDIKLNFDVDTAKIKELTETNKSLKQSFVDLDGNVATVTKKMSSGWDDANVSIKENVKAVKQSTSAIKEQSTGVSLLGHTWEEAFTRIFRYNIIAETLSTAKQAISEMVSNVIELDNHLVELQKVTDLEGESLTTFTKKAYEAGEGLAKTGTQIIDSATSFAKSGYDPDMALELGKIASIYTNIADEEVSAGESANFLIAQIKAFNLESEDTNKTLENTRHIIDSVNEVSNNFSVSSADIAKNLGISSAVMANAGNTLEETIGLNNRSIKTSLIDWKLLRGLHTKLCW